MKLHLIFCCEVGSSCHKTQNKYYENITNGTLRISVGRQISSTVDPILLIGHFPNISLPARRSGFRPFQYPGNARGKVGSQRKRSQIVCAPGASGHVSRTAQASQGPGASIPHHRGQAWYMTLPRCFSVVAKDMFPSIACRVAVEVMVCPLMCMIALHCITYFLSTCYQDNGE